ncbi:MAG: dihydroneopterin aldolase [Candidatus Bipolaricaulota bacterium]|nr:dihydroneopterin aldolase [Candidatus Bipolaricaulota bacterium]
MTSSFGLGNNEGSGIGGKELGVETQLGVEGIEVTAYHGVYDDEKERGRRFRIDVHVKGDWIDAVRSDDLRDTLDYDAIVQHIHRVNQRRRFHLIESFAGAIADDLLHDFPGLLEARVCVRKLAFPEWGPEACAVAVVTRRPAQGE